MLQGACAVILILGLGSSAVFAQTPVKPPKNSYTPEQDVELGRKAAAEIRQQYPIIEDAAIQRYLTGLGERLVAVSPRELNNPVFEYSFTPVNVKEINAFALPGGPMFVHRGMFEAAAGEGEVVGVMAHELAHVLLRHGTANASKAQNPWLQLGQLAGIVGGAIVGGAAGSAIAQGSQFGLGTLLLRYSRDFEKQADLLGAQIMARAGYDARALARMFETIEKESKGGGGPQWMSSHPNPGNRTAYITREAEQLALGQPADMSRFPATKEAFAALPPAKSMAEVARRGGSESGEAAPSVGVPGEAVPLPSLQYKNVGARGVFEARVPSNWTNSSSKQAVKYVPQNGYGQFKGQTVFTHGVEFGIAPASSRNLRTATDAWLAGLSEGNPDMRMSGDQLTTRLSQRTAIATSLVNPSPLGGRESIQIYTTFLADGNLFYYLAVVPQDDAATYETVFDRIARSIRLTDVQ
jgi:Zn-dependent protease with chaperone function